jgi:TonB family protein
VIPLRATSAFGLGLLTIAVAMSAIGQPTSQQPIPDETAPGISLQQQGKVDEAVVSLRTAVKRKKNDLRAWHYLGLALEQKGDVKEARKAHEKAANLGDDLLTDLFDEGRSGEEISKRLRPLAGKLAEAGESAQKCLQLTPKLSGRKLRERQLQADSLLVFAEIANAPPGTPTVLTSKEVSVKARILLKDEPQYTEEARKNKITGTVLLRAIFAANGRVVGIHAVFGLPYGLTEQAIETARHIKFIPAVKDGRPVSMFVQLEYSFDLH